MHGRGLTERQRPAAARVTPRRKNVRRIIARDSLGENLRRNDVQLRGHNLTTSRRRRWVRSSSLSGRKPGVYQVGSGLQAEVTSSEQGPLSRCEVVSADVGPDQSMDPRCNVGLIGAPSIPFDELMEQLFPFDYRE